MPLYEYRCRECGEVADHIVPMVEREKPVDCPYCEGKECSDLQISAVLLGGERITGDARIIHDEKQVESRYGKRWREDGTTGKPGGVGRKIIFH